MVAEILVRATLERLIYECDYEFVLEIQEHWATVFAFCSNQVSMHDRSLVSDPFEQSSNFESILEDF